MSIENLYKRLIEGNDTWAKNIIASDPDFFKRLAAGQSPDFLWIGCSDSRVPANEITGTKSGEIFVHRNIANMIVHTDLNFMSVLQYAVEVLKVKHIIVCGHYGCGGVLTALKQVDAGLVNNWLRNIKDVYVKYSDELNEILNEVDKANRLVELNVIEQATNLAKTAIVQKAWQERELHIHGWVYGLSTGKIKELGVQISGVELLDKIHQYDFKM